MSACADCLRRSWLLAELSHPLHYACLDPQEMMRTLALDDAKLIDSLAGRRRAELAGGHSRFAPTRLPRGRAVQAICVHDRDFPRALSFRAAPRLLYLSGGRSRFTALARAPTVAIVGTARATDYGMQIARGLAHGVAASGVTVVCAAAEGIALAALTGVCEGGGATLCVLRGAIDAGCPSAVRPMLAGALAKGCAAAELPCGFGAQRWCGPAGERTVVGLAALTVVVEADNCPRGLAAARLARGIGRPLAAVPGRVTTPQAAGPNSLLACGASVVRGADDVLELLRRAGADGLKPPPLPRQRLRGRLGKALARIGEGSDTPEKLLRAGQPLDQVLLTLSELELLGLVVRGDGGRYVPRAAMSRGAEVCRRGG